MDSGVKNVTGNRIILNKLIEMDKNNQINTLVLIVESCLSVTKCLESEAKLIDTLNLLVHVCIVERIVALK